MRECANPHCMCFHPLFLCPSSNYVLFPLLPGNSVNHSVMVPNMSNIFCHHCHDGERERGKGCSKRRHFRTANSYSCLPCKLATLSREWLNSPPQNLHLLRCGHRLPLLRQLLVQEHDFSNLGVLCIFCMQYSTVCSAHFMQTNLWAPAHLHFSFVYSAFLPLLL